MQEQGKLKLEEKLEEIAQYYPRDKPILHNYFRAVIYGHDIEAQFDDLYKKYLKPFEKKGLKTLILDLAEEKSLQDNSFFLNNYMKEVAAKEHPQLVILKNFDIFLSYYKQTGKSAADDFRVVSQFAEYGIVGLISMDKKEFNQKDIDKLRVDYEFEICRGLVYNLSK